MNLEITLDYAETP